MQATDAEADSTTPHTTTAKPHETQHFIDGVIRDTHTGKKSENKA